MTSTKRRVYIDFEFTGISEKVLDLVSVAWIITEKGAEVSREFLWLYRDPEAQKVAATKINEFIQEGHEFISYVLEAEIRSIFSLQDLHPECFTDFNRKFDGVDKRDLYLEYRRLLNRDDSLSYGKQLIDGEVIFTTPPPNKWEEFDKDEEEKHHKPEFSFAAAVFKLLGEKIDTEEKDEVRGLIIRGNLEEIKANKERILRYNMSDVEPLPRLWRKMVETYRTKDPDFFQGPESIVTTNWPTDFKELRMGDYAFCTAKMTRLGYPVNVEQLRKFAAASKEVMGEAAKRVNDSGVWTFRADGSMDQKAVREWVQKFVAEKNIPNWRKTPKGELSISKDAFGDYKNIIDETPFGGAFRDYLKTKQSLNGFLPPREGSKSRKTFWDFLGSDGRVRPYFGIFGSQTSRSQPASTGFMFLKAKWMRYFVQPPPGSLLVEVDYSSQEFLIAAIVSQDKKMMAAYESGDVYLAFAKDSGMIPPEEAATATKESHKKQRNIAKTIVLSVSYDISAKGLAPRLAPHLDGGCTPERAQSYIDRFFDTYPDYAQWKEDVLAAYEWEGFLKLPDGWTMWGDNTNQRSVGNFEIQGLGAVIMRKAVYELFKQNFKVLFTVHDSIICEIDVSKDYYKERARKMGHLIESTMVYSFADIMCNYGDTVPVRTDCHIWGPGATTLPEWGDYSPELSETYIVAADKKDGPEGPEKYLERYKKYFS